ncbi:MAG: hypothetical protein ACFFC3_00020 [Candidatus Odinarchaeota archaeon]
MNIVFFIYSKTVNIDNYNIKDIPGTSGRLDVISRCILAAISRYNSLERNIQIWIFLERYGIFCFNSKFFDYDFFPKNEILFSDYFVDFLRKVHNNEDLKLKSSHPIRNSKMNLIEAINYFQESNYDIYILSEQGQEFFKILNILREKQNILFIIGSQEDGYIYSQELSTLKIPKISIGNQSYLASSVIRLLKLHLLAL